MNYRNLGRTDVQVSEVGFGAWAMGGNQYGNSYGPTDDATSIRAVQRAVEIGCTFFDTADAYGHGHSEAILGQALQGHRDRVLIATKCGANFYNRGIHPQFRGRVSQYAGQDLDALPEDTVLPVTHGVDFSPEHVRFALEQSLNRLQTDHVDLLQLHNPSYDLIARGECFEVLRMLKQEGKIRFWGVSIHASEEGLAAIANGPPDVIQVVYNLFDMRPAQHLLPLAKEKGVAVIAREPLANGFLTGKFSGNERFPKGDIRESWPPQMIHARVQAAEAIRQNIPRIRSGKSTVAQFAIRCALSHDAVSVAIPGAKTPEQVEENLRASDTPPLTEDEMERLRQMFSPSA